jgi:hypothetical protein
MWSSCTQRNNKKGLKIVKVVKIFKYARFQTAVQDIEVENCWLTLMVRWMRFKPGFKGLLSTVQKEQDRYRPVSRLL